MQGTLLIAGASVRAAAASALRADLSPWCVDLFADADLARACAVQAVSLNLYPRGLIDALDAGPPGPWMYTGGLECEPSLLAIPHRELWGNGADVVRRVRDPYRLAAALADFPKLGDVSAPLSPPGRGVGGEGLSHVSNRMPMQNARDNDPDRGTAPHPRPLSPEGRGEKDGSLPLRWLIKHLHSSGGLGVREYRPGDTVPETCYLQEFIPGDPASAVFSSIDGHAHLLGATRQLIGCDWLHVPRPFQYAGSIGPFGDDAPLQDLGQTLVDAFGLRGLFGVDFIRTAHGIRPIEVNPRYPASFEILERASGQPLLEYHVRAFETSLTPNRTDIKTPRLLSRSSFGKAIYYAPHDLVVPANAPWTAAFDFVFASLAVPFADLPHPGQTIARGEPVVTLFAEGTTAAECEAALRKIAADLDHVLRER